MNKTWIIFNRRKQDAGRRDGWNYFKEIGVSRQQAEHEMKRQVEKDNNGREWAVFEMVSAYAAKVEIVEIALVDPAGDIPEIEDDVDMPVAVGGVGGVIPVREFNLRAPAPPDWPVEEDD